MELPIIIILAVIALSCSTTDKGTYLFDDLAEKETAVIYLSKYNLDSVPREIGRLTNAKRLYITADTGHWIIYPPLSALPQYSSNYNLSKQKLPDEITKLTNLKSLGLVRLNLTSLPNDIGKLRNLDSLDLTMNGLVISKELQKLKDLKGLKFLGLIGNVIDSTDIKELKQNNPNLTIQTWFE